MNTPRPIHRKRATHARPLRIVITAGPTREYFDSVRFISNPSSGKMGYAIARAAAGAGHRVTLISGPVAIPPPDGVTTIHVETAAQMSAVAKRAFRTADAAVLCAAVCDYRPKRRANRKLPKSTAGLCLELTPTEDIAAALGRVKGRRVTIGFALEDDKTRALPNALSKMSRKNLNAIVLNDPGNIGSDLASAVFLTADGTNERWPPRRKSQIAASIIRRLEAMLLGHP